MSAAPRPGGRALRVALAAVAVVPALAVMPGFEGGRLVFLEYREPKLLAALVTATAFVALFVWHRGLPATLRAVSQGLRENAELAVLGLLLGYMALGGSWVAVRENWWYELRQYSLLFVVVLLVRAWAGREPRVRTWLAGAVCAATGLLVVVGALQAAGSLPWLVPIDPGYGVRFPSLLGYKNPMALAVAGQLFLLPLLALEASDAIVGRRARTLALAGLATAFVGECAFVAFLQSRTAYLALAAGLAVLLSGAWRRAGETGAPFRRFRFPLVAALATLCVLGAIFATHAGLRARVASIKRDYVDGWSGSDRATYLLNSIAMARDRPLGVGLGDWQTHYPVHRRWNPDVAFSETVQPRRAHGDHAQLLAELGLPGLLLWVGFWATLLWRQFFAAPPDRRLRLLGVQLVVFLVAMAGDYVLEHPYLKLQFFLVLALGGREAGGVPERGSPVPSAARHPWGPWPVRAAVLLLLAGTTWEAWQAAERLHAAGLVRYHHARWLALGPVEAAAELRAAELREVLRAGERFVAARGHTKVYYKDFLALAEAALAGGRPDLANELGWESLRLHPYYSQGFGLLARVWSEADPEASRELLRAQRYVLDGPAHGFRMPYPRRRRWIGPLSTARRPAGAGRPGGPFPYLGRPSGQNGTTLPSTRLPLPRSSSEIGAPPLTRKFSWLPESNTTSTKGPSR